MLRKMNGRKGQANFGEYVLILFLVVGAASAMSVYLRRAVQARIRDAGHFVSTSAASTANYIGQIPDPDVFGGFTGNVYYQYEPYYLNTASTINSRTTQTDRLESSIGTTSGIFTKDIDEETSTQTESVTAAPGLAQ